MTTLTDPATLGLDPVRLDRVTRVLTEHVGHGLTPGSLLFAFPDDRSGSPRSMSFASGGGAISVTTIGVVEGTDRARPPSRGVARLGAAAYAAATVLPSKIDPSRQIAYRMRLKRRAKATTAIRRPRRPASRSAQARRVALPPARQQTHAACTRSARSSPAPPW